AVPAPRPPPAARAASAARPKPGNAGVPAATVSRPPAVAAARPPSSPPIDRDVARAPVATGATLAPPAVAAVPPSDDASGRAAVPAPAQGPPRLSLAVLVYSAIPADRLSFLTPRKVVQAKAVHDSSVLCCLTPPGGILS